MPGSTVTYAANGELIQAIFTAESSGSVYFASYGFACSGYTESSMPVLTELTLYGTGSSGSPVTMSFPALDCIYVPPTATPVPPTPTATPLPPTATPIPPTPTPTPVMPPRIDFDLVNEGFPNGSEYLVCHANVSISNLKPYTTYYFVWSLDTHYGEPSVTESSWYASTDANGGYFFVGPSNRSWGPAVEGNILTVGVFLQEQDFPFQIVLVVGASINYYPCGY